MTPKQTRALQALLTQPTQKAAAEAAGISDTTIRKYLADPDFQAEYKRAYTELVTQATRQAQQALSPAITALKEIVNNKGENSNTRISAARSLLEYGLRLTEFNDILTDLEVIEG